MEVFVEEIEKHIQVNEFHAGNVGDFLAFWQGLKDKYMGFEIDFCYHHCDVPVEFMSEIDAVLLESCIETRLAQANFISVGDLELTLVTAENFIKFAELHDSANPSMYWSSKRIEKDLNRWLIYMCKDNYILMSLWSEIAEIYKIEMNDRNIGEVLVSKASEYAFKTGKTGVLCMVDDDALKEFEILQAVGFIRCGRYIAYQTIIK